MVFPIINKNISNQNSALIVQAQKGSHFAFSQLVTLHSPALRLFLRRFCKSPEICEDIAQETFLKAWKNIKQMRGDAGFKTWLYSIAINEMKQHHRKNNKYNFEVSNSEYFESYSINETLDEKLDIEKLLAHLSNDEAIIISLNYGEGFSHSQISQMLNMPLGTVKSHALRGREKAVKFFHITDD